MRRLAIVTAIVILVGVTADARGEVAVIRDGAGGVIGVLQMFQVGDDVKEIWTPVRTMGDPALLLNPDGDAYRDGSPAVVINPLTQMPEAVWSYWDGAHYQIAWSRFDGQGWSMTQTTGQPDYEFLTSDERQNVDPRFWIDAAGNRRVVWWRRSLSSVDDVAVSVLPAGETQWWAPQRLSLEGFPTRHPDIRTFSSFGTFIVAEENDGGSLSPVVFDSPLLNGHTPQRGSDPWGRTVVASTSTTSPLSPSIYELFDGGRNVPVISWRVDSSRAISVYDAESLTWSSPVYVMNQEWW